MDVIIGEYYYLLASSWRLPPLPFHLDDPVDRRGEKMRFNQASFVRPYLCTALFLLFFSSLVPVCHWIWTVWTLVLSGEHYIPLPRD